MASLSASPLKLDLSIHAVALAVQFAMLLLFGFSQDGSLPPFVLPPFMILAALTLIRVHESASYYETRLVLKSAAIIAILCSVCLLLDMRRDLWGFAIPRNFPVWTRVLWYQAILLSIHPLVYPLIRRWTAQGLAFLDERGYFSRKILVTFFVAGVALWLLRSQNISSDGYDWLKFSVVPGQWALYLREPLGTMIFRIVSYWGLKLFHIDPQGSIALVSIACGLLTTWLLAKTLPLFAPKSYCPIFLALLWASGGYAMIFAGNIEIYCLLHLGLAAWLYATLRWMRGDWPAWVPGVIFGVAFCIHLSVGWWIPAFLLTPWLKARLYGLSPKPYAETGALYLGAMVFTIAFFIFLLLYGYGGDFREKYDHFWSDQVMLVGADAAMFRDVEVFLTPAYYMTMLNHYFFMFPAAFIAALLLLFAGRKMGTLEPVHLWFFVVLFFYTVYSLTWNPDRPMPSDWDIFSGLTIPVILSMVIVVTRLRLPEKAIHYLLYQALAFSAAYTLLQLILNHIRITDWPMYL